MLPDCHTRNYMASAGHHMMSQDTRTAMRVQMTKATDSECSIEPDLVLVHMPVRARGQSYAGHTETKEQMQGL